MHKIPVIKVEQIIENDKIVGIKYVDDKLVFDGAIVDFFEALETVVGPNSSAILYREDVKRFTDILEDSEYSSRELYKEIKKRIRSKYSVLKLKFNPRTLEFCGIKTAFIIHYLG